MAKLVILVTGATSGIGRHAALALARRGHAVFAAGRRAAALEGLVAEAAKEGHRIEPLVLDVTDAASIERAQGVVREITSGHGVDVLVNNAGYGHVGPLEAISDEELRGQFDTNVFGLMAMTRAFLPEMRLRGSGRIVNVGSMGGRVTFPLMGAYHATKYAVEALSDALRNELAPFGVHVSLVEPGAIRTEFNDRAMDVLERYRAERSPYAAVLARADEVRAKFESTSAGPEVVTDAIVHAAERRRPRARYVVPFSTHFALLAFRLLPTRWVDALLRAAVGLRWGSLTAAPALPPAEAR